EIVARAIYESKIPIISAVGHEIDFTIADFVADLRAPTPSAAAELAVKDRMELLKEINSYSRKLLTIQSNLIQYSKQRVKALVESYGLRRPMDFVIQRLQRTDELLKTLIKSTKNSFEFKKKSLSLVLGKLNALSPLSVFERGFSLTRKLPELTVIKDASLLKVDDHIEVKFLKGKIKSKVEKIEED
ncbi:MAG: exodeoxyribonuclease VII large subunit, partial [Candidatus Zixiibacteriota bacterium]